MTSSQSAGSELPANSLFDGAAEYYELYRVPYPQEIFDWVIREHKLDGRGRLLDSGCGTGQVALRMSSWFDEVVAIDPEQQMLDVGERSARKRAITNVRFLRMRAEEVSREVSPLRMATFGASFHWTDRVLVANRLYNLLEPGGGLVLLAPSSLWRGPEPWKQVVVQTLKDWLGADRLAASRPFRAAPLHEECLAQTPFVDLKVVDICKVHVWTTDSLVGYLYSTSFASKAVLGPLHDEFERDLRARLNTLRTEDGLAEEMEFTIISARKPG
jgi:SAM-dependent methyltransferase